MSLVKCQQFYSGRVHCDNSFNTMTQDKNAAVLYMIFPKADFGENFIEICSRGPIENESTFAQVMDWVRKGEEPLSMMKSSNGNIFRVTDPLCGERVPGDFPAKGPVTRSVDVFFDLRLNKRLSKQSWGWWFETPLRPLWRHCNAEQRKTKFWALRQNQCFVVYQQYFSWRPFYD